MIFKPHPLSISHLNPQELETDRKACRKIGPCGVGKKAIYLNSFYIDRCYYIPFTAVRRVFKRVAMSKGGFSGRGVFASIPYLVVEYDDGQQKQCNFKYENQVDTTAQRDSRSKAGKAEGGERTGITVQTGADFSITKRSGKASEGN